MGAPDTLPAEFDGWDKAPATLPADFKQWDTETRSAASPIAPPVIQRPNIPVHPSYLIGDPDKDATPQPIGDLAKGMVKNLYQVSAPGVAASLAHRFVPGALSRVPGVGDAAEKNAAPLERVPMQAAENLALMAIPGGEGEGGEIAPEAAGRDVAPVASRVPASAPSAAPGVVSRVGNLASREIRSHVPFFGRSVAKPTFEDVTEAIRGPEAKAAPAAIPETNGIPWGTRGEGTLEMRGRRIPFTDPGAPLPEHPGVFPGANLPEVPPEVRQGVGLRTGGRVPVDRSGGLGEIPVTPTYPEAPSAQAAPPEPTAPPVRTAVSRSRPQPESKAAAPSDEEFNALRYIEPQVEGTPRGELTQLLKKSVQSVKAAKRLRADRIAKAGD